MPSIPDSVAGFISAGRVGHLGTADASGRPLVVPICYAFDGTALFSAVDAKPKSVAPARLGRIRNIRVNPAVSVVIDQYEEDWTRLRYVVVQGQAEILSAGPDFSHGVDLLVAKYPQYRAMGLSRDTGVMIKVTPARIREWRYSG